MNGNKVVTSLVGFLLLFTLLLLSGRVMARGNQNPTGFAQLEPARPATGYDLSWWTADDGGQMFSTGSGYSLGGTIGQPDAGVMSGPGYTLAGGFWSGGAVIYRVYLPQVFRNYP